MYVFHLANFFLILNDLSLNPNNLPSIPKAFFFIQNTQNFPTLLIQHLSFVPRAPFPPKKLLSQPSSVPVCLKVACRFTVEEDEEALRKELQEAFRIYDKEGNG